MKLAILSRAPRSYSTQRLRTAALDRGHQVKVLNTLRFAIDLSGDEPDLQFRGKQLSDYDAVMTLGNDLGMQLTFHREVKALDRAGLDPAWVEKEREIFVAQSANMPEEKRKVVAEGRLNKRLAEVVLLEMPFLKNDKVTVQQHVDAVAKEAGVKVRVARFARIGAGA